MEHYLMEYGPIVGYIVLFLGSCIEGESVVLTAGFFSYKGYLSLPIIMAVAFMGTLLADQGCYFIGRIYGPGWIDRRPTLKAKAAKAFQLLHRYNIWFIMGCRFIYGIRIVSPFVIGASGIPVRRFAILNVIAAAVWSVLSCSAGYALGYFFADRLGYALDQAVKFQKFTIGGLALIVVGFLAFRYYCRRKKKSNT
jgi:membrane protein DedA with SNARE-associated domain